MKISSELQWSLFLSGNQGIQRGQSKFRRGGRIVGNLQNNRGSFPGRSGRGRGRGGLTRSMRGNRNNKPGAIPTKEELDRELEQYMANTKSQLDKDIDAYMKESTETQEMWD